MSTSARVNSNSCTFAFSIRLFWKEAKRKEGNAKEMRSGLPPLDSASSVSARPGKASTKTTDDSGQALDLPPNPALLALAAVSADNLTKIASSLYRPEGAPFARASEADSEQRARLLLASAPLPRKIQSRALRR